MKRLAQESPSTFKSRVLGASARREGGLLAATDRPLSAASERMRVRVGRVSSLLLVCALLVISSGCAFHYFDPTTGAEHVWGVGHMVLKASAPREGLRTVVRGTELIGLSIGNVDGQGYITAGWHRRNNLEVLDENASIRLEWPRLAWPGNRYFSVRVGSEWPQLFDQPRNGGHEEDDQ